MGNDAIPFPKVVLIAVKKTNHTRVKCSKRTFKRRAATLRTTSTPIFVVVVSISRGSGLTIHYKRPSKREVTTPTPHKPHLSSCSFCFCHINLILFKSRLWHLLSALSGQVSALRFAQKHSWILLGRHCDASTRKKESLFCPYHSPALRTSSTVVLRSQKTYTCHKKRLGKRSNWDNRATSSAIVRSQEGFENVLFGGRETRPSTSRQTCATEPGWAGSHIFRNRLVACEASLPGMM